MAGPPRIFDEKEAWKRIYEPDTQAQLARQASILQGNEGGLLWAVSAASGETLSRGELASVPVWAGMAAAYGRLYVPMEDGTVVCLGKE